MDGGWGGDLEIDEDVLDEQGSLPGSSGGNNLNSITPSSVAGAATAPVPLPSVAFSAAAPAAPPPSVVFGAPLRPPAGGDAGKGAAASPCHHPSGRLAATLGPEAGGASPSQAATSGSFDGGVAARGPQQSAAAAVALTASPQESAFSLAAKQQLEAELEFDEVGLLEEEDEGPLAPPSVRPGGGAFEASQPQRKAPADVPLDPFAAAGASEAHLPKRLPQNVLDTVTPAFGFASQRGDARASRSQAGLTDTGKKQDSGNSLLDSFTRMDNFGWSPQPGDASRQSAPGHGIDDGLANTPEAHGPNASQLHWSQRHARSRSPKDVKKVPSLAEPVQGHLVSSQETPARAQPPQQRPQGEEEALALASVPTPRPPPRSGWARLEPETEVLGPEPRPDEEADDEASLIERCRREGPPGPASATMVAVGGGAQFASLGAASAGGLGSAAAGAPLAECVTWLSALKAVPMPFTRFHLGVVGLEAAPANSDTVSPMRTHNVAAVLRHGWPPQRWHLLVLVRRVEVVAGEFSAEVEDVTGVMQATIDRRVLRSHPHAATEGTTLLLANVVAAAVGSRTPRLLVMERTLYRSFNASDAGPEEAAKLVAEARAALQQQRDDEASLQRPMQHAV